MSRDLLLLFFCYCRGTYHAIQADGVEMFGRIFRFLFFHLVIEKKLRRRLGQLMHAEFLIKVFKLNIFHIAHLYTVQLNFLNRFFLLLKSYAAAELHYFDIYSDVFLLCKLLKNSYFVPLIYDIKFKL